MINKLSTRCMVIAVACLSCTPTLAQDITTLLSSPKALVFAAREDTPPLSSRINEQWKGYSIDLCNRIYQQYVKRFRSQNYNSDIDISSPPGRPDFTAVEAPKRFQKLKSGEIHILCGATTVTLSRMSQANFTLLTYLSGMSIMKMAKTSSKLLSLSASSDKQIRVTFVGGTTTQALIQTLFPESNQIKAHNHRIAFNNLKNDQADFYFGDRVILNGLIAEEKIISHYHVSPRFFSYEPYAIAVSPKRPDLLFIANQVLAELYKSGEINNIYKKYFTGKQSELIKAMFQIQSFSVD